MTENEYTTRTLEVLLSAFMFLACSSEEKFHLPENLEANLSDHLYYVTQTLTLWLKKMCLGASHYSEYTKSNSLSYNVFFLYHICCVS